MAVCRLSSIVASAHRWQGRNHGEAVQRPRRPGLWRLRQLFRWPIVTYTRVARGARLAWAAGWTIFPFLVGRPLRGIADATCSGLADVDGHRGGHLATVVAAAALSRRGTSPSGDHRLEARWSDPRVSGSIRSGPHRTTMLSEPAREARCTWIGNRSRRCSARRRPKQEYALAGTRLSRHGGGPCGVGQMVRDAASRTDSGG